jgi:hypothetical protein
VTEKLYRIVVVLLLLGIFTIQAVQFYRKKPSAQQHPVPVEITNSSLDVDVRHSVTVEGEVEISNRELPVRVENTAPIPVHVERY